MALSIAVKDLSKSFGQTRALDAVNVSIAAGRTHGFVGPNGSGKSTLIGILTGLLRPDRGAIEIDGKSHGRLTANAARKLGIELVPQELALVPAFKVWENIVLGDEPKGPHVSRAEGRRIARKVLDELGLDIGVDEDTFMLDPGEQRLVMFARTFHRKARMVIFDEPTAGLGEEDSRTVMEALRKLKGSGTTVVFVSHYLSEVAEVCDEVTVMRDGRFAARLHGQTLTVDRLIEEMSGTYVKKSRAERPASGNRAMMVEGRHLAMPPLRQLNFKLYENECLGFAGLLGSGREKVIDAISGAVRLWGSVRVHGEFIENPREAIESGLGILTGNRQLAIVPGWNVEKHMSLPALDQLSRSGFLDSAKEREAAQSAINRLGVKAMPTDELADLSGGNQQRALLSRWLMCGAEVLLIDEPCLGVDIAARADLLVAIRDYARSNAVILASSDALDLVECCDRVLCLRKGVVVKELIGDEITETAILRATMTSATRAVVTA
jgi:ABC-type sugar transport system ATPase subunit